MHNYYIMRSDSNKQRCHIPHLSAAADYWVRFKSGNILLPQNKFLHLTSPQSKFFILACFCYINSDIYMKCGIIEDTSDRQDTG